jgi:hypothetical protein
MIDWLVFNANFSYLNYDCTLCTFESLIKIITKALFFQYTNQWMNEMIYTKEHLKDKDTQM